MFFLFFCFLLFLLLFFFILSFVFFKFSSFVIYKFFSFVVKLFFSFVFFDFFFCFVLFLPSEIFLRMVNHIFSTTLSLALLALGFSSSSFFDGVMGFLSISFTKGFFPHIHTGNSLGHVHGFAFL
jgi:hypothetical protein